MFNFLLNTKAGEYLAPVAGTNQLFLAIQYHKDEQFKNLIQTASYETNQKFILREHGYSCIHVACRYNNEFATELLLAKGMKFNSFLK